MLGARHLYLLDFDPTNLPDLKSTIQQKYPDVKVGSPVQLTVRPLTKSMQVTTVQADASDEAAIKGLCDRAIQEEGQLDVFFANVRGVELTFPPLLTSLVRRDGLRATLCKPRLSRRTRRL